MFFELVKYDGLDFLKLIYVVIKGWVFDVFVWSEMYVLGKGYNVFVGKDGSKGLGEYVGGVCGWLCRDVVVGCKGCCGGLFVVEWELDVDVELVGVVFWKGVCVCSGLCWWV